MRALIFILLWMLAQPAARSAEDTAPASGQFDQANKLYEQGKFAEAALAYQKLIESGAATANVWFNLGTAAYKAGQFGRSIAAYRQVELRHPREAALRANLQLVRSKIYTDERGGPPAWKNWARLATVNEWTVASLGFFWLGFALLAFGQWRKRPVGRAAAALFLGFALAGAGALAAYQDATTPQAVVVAKEATVRFGPIEESQAAFQLRDGAELTVLDRKDDWLNIRDPEKRVGWIRRDATTPVSGW